MGTKTRWAGIALMIVGLTLTGCAAASPGSPGDASASTPSSDPEVPAESESPDEATPEASLDDPCAMLTPADLAGIVGAEPAAGRDSQATMQQNDDKWQAVSCTWELGEEEIGLTISQPSGFTEISYSCLAPLGGAGDVADVPGIGTQAWFKVSEFALPSGRLRVCAADFFFDVEVKRSADHAALQQQAIAIAQLVHERSQN